MSQGGYSLVQSFAALGIQTPVPGHSCIDHLLQLPVRAIQKICASLSSRDILALSASCRQLQPWSCWAYQIIHFEIGHGVVDEMMQIVASLQRLLEVLEFRPVYQSYVTVISLYDWYLERRWSNLPSEHYTNMTNVMDMFLGRIVSHSPNLKAFILDLSSTGLILPCPNTIQSLISSSQLVELALQNVTCAVDPTQLPQTASRFLQRVRIRGDGANMHWGDIFLRGQGNLQKLALLPYGCFRPETLEQSAVSWGNLEELSIVCDEDNSAAYFQLLSQCSAMSIWSRLSTLSLAGRYSLQYLGSLNHLQLRRLRLIVNTRGTYSPDFGPGLLGGILQCFPTLEELVLDHMEMTEHMPILTPDILTEWGAQIRNAARLRVLAMPALFVVYPAPEYDDEADDEETEDEVEGEDDDQWSLDGEDGYTDVSDDLDMSSTIGKGKQPMHAVYSSLRTQSYSSSLWQEIAVFAEDFFDTYVQSTTLRLWILHDDPETGRRRSIGFEPTVDLLDTYDGPRQGIMSRTLESRYAMFWEPEWRTE